MWKNQPWGCVAALVPTAAWASDPTGLLSYMFLWAVLGPTTFINLIVIAILASRNTYSSWRASIRHAVIASIPPGLGLVVSMVDHRTASDLVILFAFYGAALLLALAPLAIHRLLKSPGRPHG